MSRRFAQIVGAVLAVLGVVGLIVGEGQLWGLFNIDLGMDLLRLAFAGALLYAGFGTDNAGITRTVLTVGVLYIGMGLLAIASPQMFGLLPSGLTGFDIAYHLVVGALGIVATRTSEQGAHGITT